MCEDLGTLSALNAYLEDSVDGFHSLKRVTKFTDGQSNPTYALEADSGRYVLRAQPTGELLKSAHAVDREYTVMRALEKTNVPVPETYHLCTDKSVIGRLFFIMEHVDGRILWNPAMPDCERGERHAVYTEMNRTLANLHNVDMASVGLENFGKAGNYYERQLSRWSQQYHATETDHIAAMHRLIQWLEANLPADDGQVSLIHGDFRIDNIMFDTHSPAVSALLDWELSTLGHPYADLAYQCMQWRLSNSAVVPGLAEIDRSALGIPTEKEYVALYCRHRGIANIDNWPFYLAFGFFRFAAIVQGVLKRALDGNASSPKAIAYGELTPILARLGLQAIEEGES